MFWHNFKYELKCAFRNKEFLFWLICFPIILGFFFKIAFSNIYEEQIKFDAVPTAIVQTEANEVFDAVIDEVSGGKDALFEITRCDEEKALEKLENGDVFAVIYADNLSMTVRKEGIEQTIVKSFLDQYRTQESVIMDTLQNNPEALEDVMAAFEVSEICNENVKLTDASMDDTVQYFYNLIAMVALFGSMTGIHISMINQGNLSAIGARKCISPTHRFVSDVSAIIASCLAQAVCIVIAVTYVVYVLGVDFGNKVPYVYLAGVIGGCMGVSLGFFVGSLGRLKEGVKVGIVMAVSMFSCFLSGLMVSNMKSLISLAAPWFNNINPATVISDAFFCLNIYDDFEKYTIKILTMLGMTALFTVLGFLVTRRRKYASL